VDRFFRLLFFLFLLSLLLFRRLRFLLRLLLVLLLLSWRRRGLFLFRRSLFRRLLLDKRAETPPEVVDLPLLTEAVSLGPFDEFGLLGGADLGGRGERLLGLGDLRDGGLLRLLRRLGVRLRLLLLEEVFDDEFGALHGGLQREVAVDDLHLVREALLDPDDHVSQVGRERAHESRLFPPRELAPYGGLLPFHIDAQPGVREPASE